MRPAALDVGSSPVPLVVTATRPTAAPAAAYPVNNVGVVAADPAHRTGPPPLTFGNRMKASFAQFLSIRHGGSGFVFGYGIGATGQNDKGSDGQSQRPQAARLRDVNPIPADRPFHSLSNPDIDYTILRPARGRHRHIAIRMPATPAHPAWPPSTRRRRRRPGRAKPVALPGFSHQRDRDARSGEPPRTSSRGKSAPDAPGHPPAALFQPPERDVRPLPRQRYSNAGEHRRSVPEQPGARDRDRPPRPSVPPSPSCG